MAVYLHVDGIEGDVTASGHEGWIECHSLQWGVGRGINTPTGGSTNRESTAPSISEVSLTKAMDKCSPLLFVESCVGLGKLVKIDLVQTGGDALETYMAYELTDALISGYSVSSGGEVPSESMSFNFTKVEMKYTPFDKLNNPEAPVPAGYDIGLGKKVS